MPFGQPSLIHGYANPVGRLTMNIKRLVKFAVSPSSLFRGPRPPDALAWGFAKGEFGRQAAYRLPYAANAATRVEVLSYLGPYYYRSMPELDDPCWNYEGAS